MNNFVSTIVLAGLVAASGCAKKEEAKEDPKPEVDPSPSRWQQPPSLFEDEQVAEPSNQIRPWSPPTEGSGGGAAGGGPSSPDGTLGGGGPGSEDGGTAGGTSGTGDAPGLGGEAGQGGAPGSGQSSGTGGTSTGGDISSSGGPATSEDESTEAHSTSTVPGGTPSSEQVEDRPVDPRRWAIDAGDSEGPTGVVFPKAPPDLSIDDSAIDALALPDGDPMKSVVGVWEQSHGSSLADFAPGGYTQTILVLRTDGVIDITRLYGTRGELQIEARIDYSIEDDTMRIGAEERYRKAVLKRAPPPQTLSDGTRAVVTLPEMKLPATLPYSLQDGRLKLGSKTYRRVQRTRK